MKPTRRGFFLIGTGLVSYMLAYQSNVGWFYVADAFIWGIVLINLAFPWWSLRGLQARRRLVLDESAAADGIFEGDTVRVTLEVANPGRIPRYFFTATDRCPLEAPNRESKRALVGYVAPGSSVTWSYAAECYRRGEHRFGALSLECSAPFGLFRARRRVEATLQVLVYPQIFNFARAMPQGELREGPSVPTAAQRVGEFRGSREHQPGDSLRQVHWRSSARSGRLMVKEYDRGPEHQVALFFNARHNPSTSGRTDKETTLEYGIKLAASIAWECLGAGTSLWMAPPGLGEAFSGH